MKRLTCLLIPVLLLLSAALPVFAEEGCPNGESHNYVLTSDTATCGSEGTATYECSSCGATKTETSPPKGAHTYEIAGSLGAEKHKIICTVCNQEGEANHQWSETILTEATCTQAGEKKFTCGCGETKTQEIPATGHIYDKDENNHTCRNCSEQGAHVWSEEKVTKKPTCKDTGTSESQCTVCGKTRVSVLEKLTTHTYDSACDPKCNVCGDVRNNVSHTFDTVWSKDQDGHWHECSKCGEKKDFAKHNPGPEATEDREQICQVCSYVVTPKKKHVHQFAKEWTTDAVGHWHDCAGCKEEKDFASHEFDDACDSDCNICGYKRKDGHTFEEVWQTNPFEHWRVCTNCGTKSPLEKHIPGPEATEEEPQICTVCKMELNPVQIHTHHFGMEWVQTEDGHYQQCKCGEESVLEPHIWDAGKEGKEHKIRYTCTKCGMERIADKPAARFSWVIFVLGLVALACIGGIGALVFILKQGAFDTEKDAQTDEAESTEMTLDE